MSDHLISLASGVLPEFTPVQTATAAVESGFRAVGLWVDPATWDAGVTREVRRIVAELGTDRIGRRGDLDPARPTGPRPSADRGHRRGDRGAPIFWW